MKLLILESFCYELHVFYWYFMFHLKLDLYLSAFPTVVQSQQLGLLESFLGGGVGRGGLSSSSPPNPSVSSRDLTWT